MTPLSKRETDALTSLCKLLIDECLENHHKITALERSLNTHPEIETQYRKELAVVKQPEPSATFHAGLKKLNDALVGRP